MKLFNLKSFLIISLCIPFAVSKISEKVFEASTNRGFFSVVPNDPSSGSDWHIDTIDLNEAWEISTSYYQPIGIIDSGIHASHYDLYSNYNSTLSHDFVSRNNGDEYGPDMDFVDHGTKVAGLIGAKGNNSQGIAGEIWSSNLVSLRIDSDGTNHLEDVDAFIDAINYAKNNGIGIVNFSGGFLHITGSTPSDPNGYNYADHAKIYSNKIPQLSSAIASYDGLIVCAAGNKGLELNSNFEIYPQILDYSNIIVVGASEQNDSPCTFSNYSATNVDLFAPGSAYYPINSTNNNGGISGFTHTSAAAPLVTGVIGLMKSVNPNLTNLQIKSKLLNNVDTFSSLTNKCVSGGRLNAYKAIKAALPAYSQGQTLSSPGTILSNEHQWFKITITSPGTHVFSKQYNSLVLATGLYSDIQGTPIASGTTGSGTLFYHTFSSPGSYYLKVTNCSAGSGTYSISIS